MSIQFNPLLSYTGALRYERLPTICYTCGRIGLIQIGCYCHPQAVDLVEISYDEWIIADSDPSHLLWLFDPIHVKQQRSSSLILRRPVHLLPEPPPLMTNQHINSMENEPGHDQLHKNDDDVDENCASLSSYGDVTYGSRIRSTIHNLGLQ